MPARKSALQNQIERAVRNAADIRPLGTIMWAPGGELVITKEHFLWNPYRKGQLAEAVDPRRGAAGSRSLGLFGVKEGLSVDDQGLAAGAVRALPPGRYRISGEHGVAALIDMVGTGRRITTIHFQGRAMLTFEPRGVLVIGDNRQPHRLRCDPSEVRISIDGGPYRVVGLSGRESVRPGDIIDPPVSGTLEFWSVADSSGGGISLRGLPMLTVQPLVVRARKLGWRQRSAIAAPGTRFDAPHATQDEIAALARLVVPTRRLVEGAGFDGREVLYALLAVVRDLPGKWIRLHPLTAAMLSRYQAWAMDNGGLPTEAAGPLDDGNDDSAEMDETFADALRELVGAVLEAVGTRSSSSAGLTLAGLSPHRALTQDARAILRSTYGPRLGVLFPETHCCIETFRQNGLDFPSLDDLHKWLYLRTRAAA